MKPNIVVAACWYSKHISIPVWPVDCCLPINVFEVQVQKKLQHHTEYHSKEKTCIWNKEKLWGRPRRGSTSSPPFPKHSFTHWDISFTASCSYILAWGLVFWEIGMAASWSPGCPHQLTHSVLIGPNCSTPPPPPSLWRIRLAVKPADLCCCHSQP